MILLLCLLLLDSAPVYFEKKVAPILNKRCLGCHNDSLNDGGLSLATRKSVLKGGGRGPVLIPGKPQQSLLIEAVRRAGDIKMPPGNKLSAREISILEIWIRREEP